MNILLQDVCRSTVLAFWALFAALAPANATDLYRTVAGLRYYTGGVTTEELRAVALLRTRHNFVLQVVSGLSGGPIADADVRITSPAGKVLLAAPMDGPWLLVSLLPGRYRIAVSFQDELLQREVEIAATGQSRMTLSFRSSPEVSLLPLR